jgi:hypothetical protein
LAHVAPILTEEAPGVESRDDSGGGNV